MKTFVVKMSYINPFTIATRNAQNAPETHKPVNACSLNDVHLPISSCPFQLLPNRCQTGHREWRRLGEGVGLLQEQWGIGTAGAWGRGEGCCLAPFQVSPSNREQGFHPANQIVGPQEWNRDHYNVRT